MLQTAEKNDGALQRKRLLFSKYNDFFYCVYNNKSSYSCIWHTFHLLSGCRKITRFYTSQQHTILELKLDFEWIKLEKWWYFIFTADVTGRVWVTSSLSDCLSLLSILYNITSYSCIWHTFHLLSGCKKNNKILHFPKIYNTRSKVRFWVDKVRKMMIFYLYFLRTDVTGSYVTSCQNNNITDVVMENLFFKWFLNCKGFW